MPARGADAAGGLAFAAAMGNAGVDRVVSPSDGAATVREIKPLTTLRALAALLVFLYHYAVLHAPGAGTGVPLRAVWAHGYLGVPMFFVLSGFLLTRLYFDPLRAGRVDLGTFLVRRVARIWPCSWRWPWCSTWCRGGSGERNPMRAGW